MWPTLISIGPLAIHSFGLMIALGVFFGGFVFWQKAKEEGFEEDLIMDSWFVAGLTGLFGGRIWHILINWLEFKGSWYKMIFLTKFPGLAYEGVLLGAILGIIIFSLRKKWNVWQYGEAVVFGYVIVEIFAWIGSFLGGSNLGKVTKWWWGIGFPGVEHKRHPVQLLLLIIFVLLYLLLRKLEKEYRSFSWYQQKKGESQPGFLIAIYLISIGVVRFGLSYLAEGVNQRFGLMLILFGGLILFFRSGIFVKLLGKPRKFEKTEIRENELIVKSKLKKRKKQGFDFK